MTFLADSICLEFNLEGSRAFKPKDPNFKVFPEQETPRIFFPPFCAFLYFVLAGISIS
jgi:hypothetical protein